MAPTPIPGKDSPRTLTSILETAFKFAGAVAVFGYLSLRAHLNYLGIPMTRSLGPERYLMEAGYAISYVATWGGFVILGALLIGTGAWSLSCLLPWRLRHWVRTLDLGGGIAHFCGTRWCPFLLLTAFILFWLAALSQIVQLAQKPVIGDLESRGLFFLLLTVCCAGYAACRWIPRTVQADERAGADLVARVLWIMTGAVVVLVALLIPTTFGCCVRPADYYRVELLVERAKDEKTADHTCGLLVFETDSNLFLWRVASASKGATGSVEVIQRAQVKQMRVGPPQDLRDAIKESKKSQENTTDNLCPKAGGQL